MRAYVLHGIGDIRLEERKKPVPKENEALLSVRAAGVCGSDIPRIYRTGAHSHPLIVGHEFSGVVCEAGPGCDPGWIGKRVGVFPLIPCKSCIPCQKKQYEMCQNYGYLGSRQDGGFAEYVAVSQENLIELPKEISFEAAAMLEPMAVAVHAMRRTGLGAGLSEGNMEGEPASNLPKTAAVCGLGTIGMLLAQFLKEAGVLELFVIGNKDFQRKTVLENGISEEFFCDSRTQDAEEWIMERTAGEGVDLFFECVGKNDTLVQAVNLTAAGGTVMLVGNPASDMGLPRDVYWKILRRQMRVTGTWNSSFTHEAEDDWHYVLRRLSQKRIAPEALISHRFSLKELEKGFLLMRDKTEEYGKVMGVF